VLAGVFETPDGRTTFAPQRTVTHGEFKVWLYRLGEFAGSWTKRPAADSIEAALAAQGLGHAVWSSQDAPSPETPLSRGEGCRALFALLEKLGH
jgi:hypothetical protein